MNCVSFFKFILLDSNPWWFLPIFIETGYKKTNSAKSVIRYENNSRKHCLPEQFYHIGHMDDSNLSSGFL